LISALLQQDSGHIGDVTDTGRSDGDLPGLLSGKCNELRDAFFAPRRRRYMPSGSIAEIAVRWSVRPIDIVGWAIDGRIALSTAQPLVETKWKRAAQGFGRHRAD
jgi:hypothetical protein